MTETSPGVITNTARKNGRTVDARRMRGLETAADHLGGQSALADVLGISTRHLRQKMAAERPIHNEDLGLIVFALRSRAHKTDELANKLLDLIE